MEILKDFGVNPILLIAQIVNFLIIFYLLKRFAYKPILEILRKREFDIKKGIKDSEEGQKILADAQDQEQKMLKSAQAQADKIVGEARIQAEEMASEIELKAKTQSERLITGARLTIQQETEDAENKLMARVSGIALKILENSLSHLLDKNQQKTLIKKAADQIRLEHNE
ncbi:MAG: ATP synthase F0 subunit B [Candidatus Levybacteria bacterium RIFOXYA1_FULL_41_10]|nr:MAG: ATP synthase subunit b [Candidatus Levybacteria bacterium GW2011_GWB1_36_18]KKR17981.1 MAG: ATP synthase subunit b [Candidatus Levybacteria bacterium GW2011_GWA1_39_32]KKR51587.1 MAG: ATP synthase subunit b [Candidatus Levybacteria bacterium GW2011_GWC1_40_19]KKR73775.1 MAG: ATP synthase subunit b [Candidatus Levybacteria bacterium GW2011_GWC2_40_7]KKR95234.1 MAG: ATP synthase subunit b [Candidatus Levybacteria bacterium GW2011_GWA2_41_15]OGH20875.1 MAG: ATP synthase F0 subunit B [Cand